MALGGAARRLLEAAAPAAAAPAACRTARGGLAMPSATAHAPPTLRLPLRPYQEEDIQALQPRTAENLR